MASKLTFRQLVVSILALVEGLGHKEIAARLGTTREIIAEYLGRKRKKELAEEIYEWLLSIFRRWRASAAVVKACLEALESLDREKDLSDEELAAVEEEVLTGSRLMRKLLIAAIRKSRVSRLVEEGFPHGFEVPIARQRAEEQFRELKRLDARSRLAVVKLTRDYQNWALVERCCEAAIEQGSRDLKRSASWARLALAVAKWVPGLEGWRTRVRGFALAHWANLLRVKGDLITADIRLEEAKALWAVGCDPSGLLDPGKLLDIEGSLRRDQRRFEEAHSCFDRALPISRFPERILINKGFTYEVMGDYEHAIETLLTAEPYVERRGDPRLRNMLRLNRSNALCHASRHGEAAQLVEKVRRSPDGLGKLDLARIPWLEGRILAGLGRREEALRKLAEARQSFETEQMDYDVILALLEESGLLLAEGRLAAVKALAPELTEMFESKGVHREALAAVQVFEDAVRQETASAELARRILGFLFRARHDQGLQFKS